MINLILKKNYSFKYYNIIKNNRQDEDWLKLIQEIRNQHKIFPQIGQILSKYNVIEKNFPIIYYKIFHSYNDYFNNLNKKRKENFDNEVKEEKFKIK